MKKGLLLLIGLASLLSCEGTQDELLDDATRFIQDKKKQNKPRDAYLRVENNSNFVMEDFEIGFHKNDAIALNSIAPDSIYSYTGFDQISNFPYIRFTVNQDIYKREFINTSEQLTSGNFVLKLEINSVINQTFSYQIVQE